MTRYATVLAFVFAVGACSQAGAQTRPVNLGKSIVRVAHPGELVMAGMPGMPMPQGYANNYASQLDLSFDPSIGANGTINLRYLFTGALITPNIMCNNQSAIHTPQISVQFLKNGVVQNTQPGSGYGVAPCISMYQTVTVSFDLAANGCTQQDLGTGVCSFSEQSDQVWCTILGAFARFLKDIQLELASDQFLGTYAPTPPGGQNLTLNCLTPPYAAAPDWDANAGGLPTWTSSPGAPSHPHDFGATANLYRVGPMFGSFNGILWHFLAQFGPTIDSTDSGSVACTNKDANQKGPGGIY